MNDNAAFITPVTDLPNEAEQKRLRQRWLDIMTHGPDVTAIDTTHSHMTEHQGA